MVIFMVIMVTNILMVICVGFRNRASYANILNGSVVLFNKSIVNTLEKFNGVIFDIRISRSRRRYIIRNDESDFVCVGRHNVLIVLVFRRYGKQILYDFNNSENEIRSILIATFSFGNGRLMMHIQTRLSVQHIIVNR